MKYNYVVCLLFMVLIYILSGCSKGEDVVNGDGGTIPTQEELNDHTESVGVKRDDFLGVWNKENSSHLLYVVGDGTVYYGNMCDRKDIGDDLLQIMYESSNIFNDEMKGEKLQITSSSDKYNETHLFEKNGDVLIDEEGIQWKYIKSSVQTIKDEGLY